MVAYLNDQLENQASRYLLPRSVHLCTVGHHAIFLDLSTNSFVSVPRPQEYAAALPCLDRVRDTQDAILYLQRPDVAESLVARGLLITDHAVGREIRPTEAEPPTSSLLDSDEPWPTVSLIDIVRFIRARITATKVLISGKWLHAVRAIGRCRSRVRCMQTPPDESKVLRVVRVYQRLRPFFPRAKRSDLCDSVTMVHFLADYGISAHYVLGVRLMPFQVCSWVQKNGATLNERPEYVGKFTPIFVA